MPLSQLPSGNTCLVRKNDSCNAVVTRSTFTNNKYKHTHTYLIWDKCLSCENTQWGKAFSAWRQPHRDCSLSFLPCCPHGPVLCPRSFVQLPSHQCPELACLQNPRLAGSCMQAVSIQTAQGPSSKGQFCCPCPPSCNPTISRFPSTLCYFFLGSFAVFAIQASISLSGSQIRLCRLSRVNDKGSSMDGVPLTHTGYTTDWTYAVACSDFLHTAHAPGQGNPLSHWTTCCLLTTFESLSLGQTPLCYASCTELSSCPSLLLLGQLIRTHTCNLLPRLPLAA